MIKKVLCFLLLSLLLTGAACAEGGIDRLEQLNAPGITIGVSQGDIAELVIHKELPEASVAYFTDKFMGYVAVAQGKIDAFAYDRRQMELSIANGQKGVRLLSETLNEKMKVAVGLSPVSRIPDLEGKINRFIAELRADGTLDDMFDRWVIRAEETMPDIPLPENPALHLTVATSGIVPPYSYYVGMELNGYDIELAYRFAAWLGADLSFKVYDYDAIVPAAMAGDVDCIMANLEYTEERAGEMPYSDLLFEVSIGLMVKEQAGGAAASAPDAGDGFGYLEDKRIGVGTGSIQVLQVEERFPNAELYYFSTDVDMLSALRANKIDAFATAETLIRFMMAENPDLTRLDGWLGEGMLVGAVFPKTDSGQALCDEFNAFIQKIRQNGVYEEIQDTWFGVDEEKHVVPDLDSLPAVKGTLRMAADTSLVPFVYVKDGKPVGIDIDTCVRFCREYGYALEVVPMDFSGIIPSVVTGKVDFACSGIAYTPERAESVLFSEPTFESGSVLAVLKTAEAAAPAAPAAEAEPTFWDGITASFNKTFIREDRWKLFTDGVLTTLLITVLSILCGTALGFVIFMLCRKGNIIANGATRFSMWLVQGMPMVVLLMILYYIIFGSVAISGLVVAVIGFTLTFGASVFGLLKMGVGAVDGGQYEAAYALGYSSRRTFFKIILPQALPHVMPAYKGEIVGLIKATAIVGYIAVQDLTKMGDIVRSRTYEAFFPLIAVTVIYFVLEGLLGFLISRIQVRLDPKRRRRESILKGVSGPQ